MKHSVNFYLDELRPKVYYLTVKNMVLGVVACALLIFIWQLVLTNQIDSNKHKIRVTQQQLTTAKAKLDGLQSELVKHNDKATFNQRKQRLEKSLEAKRMLWEGVGKRIEAASVNYYNLMDELTKLHEENIWLSEFKFDQNSALFSGFALDSSAVTRWMTLLQSSEAFRGKEFSHLDMKAFDDHSLAFVIATEQQDDLQSPVMATTGNIPNMPDISEITLPPGVIGNE